MLILPSADLAHDPLAMLTRVARFLGIDPELTRPSQLRFENAFMLPRGKWSRRLADNRRARYPGRAFSPGTQRWIYEQFLLKPGQKPAMGQRARQLLCGLYRDDAQRTERLLGSSLERSWR